MTPATKTEGAAPETTDLAALLRREHEIKAAHEDAEATLRTARDPLLILYADLRVKTANRAFYKIFHTVPAETEGRLIYELGNGQWRIPRLRQLLEEILPHNSFFEDFEIVHDFPAIGSRTMLLNSRRLETENTSQLILLSIEDVTDRLVSRAAMKRSEARYRGLFEAAQDGIVMLDPISRKITDANPFMTRLLGYTREELLGKELWEIGLLKDERASQDAFRELQEKNFIRYEDLPLQTKTGERREVEFVSNLYDEDGLKVIQCNIRDITARKRVDDALRESRLVMKRSEIRYRRLFEATQDGIISLDPVTRKITDANPFVTQLLGYERGELLGKELWQIDLFKDEQASQAAFRELQNRGFVRYEYLPLETKSGQRREVEFLSNLYDEDGQKVIQCNLRDITERKRTDTALRQAIADLKVAQGAAERASRAKDNFLAALSHELRTPLTPVLMSAAALREDERLPSDAREQLAMMELNIALEARLIDDLLDLTKIAHGKLQLRAQPCDAHHLIRRSVEIVREEARLKEIAIECTFGAKHSRLMADPARFQQVIWNLLRNAVKFTPRGGWISIHTHDERQAGGEMWLRIEVSDSGIGIDPARLEQIFLHFDQGGLAGDHRFGGVGLGLAIARAVVDLHGGRINAHSAGVNRGARFVVDLPGAIEASSGVSDSTPPSVGGSPVPFAPAVFAPLRLLLVEDHPNTLQTLFRLLQRNGHRIVTASTVAEALAAAALDTFDLVVSDLGLPDGTGCELMEKLRDTYGLRGVALSGYGTEEDIARSRDAGFVTHLVKPVPIAELRRVIAEFPAARNDSVAIA